MSKLYNMDILEDLYLQYEDMRTALNKYLELYNLDIVELKNITILNNDYTLTTKYTDVLEDVKNQENIINWYNFNLNDKYYTDTDNVYKITFIDHKNKIVHIEKYK